MTDAVDFYGKNAGSVYRFLESKKSEPQTISQIKKGARLKEFEVHGALGWLAREHKIQISGNEDNIKISLI